MVDAKGMASAHRGIGDMSARGWLSDGAPQLHGAGDALAPRVSMITRSRPSVLAALLASTSFISPILNDPWTNQIRPSLAASPRLASAPIPRAHAGEPAPTRIRTTEAEQSLPDVNSPPIAVGDADGDGARHPIIPPEFADKLETLNWRAEDSSGPKKSDAASDRDKSDHDSADGGDDEFLAFWHGDIPIEDSRPWAVHGIMPEVGCGLLSGQWGTYKTFIADDVAAAFMTGTPIFDSNIDRRGGVLFYAAEGETEVAIRIQAAMENRCSSMAAAPFDPKHAPFAWLTPAKLPLCLLDPRSVQGFVARCRRIDAEMRQRFGVPLALIIIDTVVATAGYKRPGDEYDTTLGARLMKEGLTVIAHETGTFVLGIDHFGKDADTGTRGASSKEDNADTLLAALGTKDITGVVTNPRLVLRKVRGAAGGREYPFSVRLVDLGLDAKGQPSTTLVIDWNAAADETGQQQKEDGWGKSSSMVTLRRCLMNVNFQEEGTEIRPWPDAAPVRAVKCDAIENEFRKSYVARSGTPSAAEEAKRKAFERALADAQQRNLIGYRTIDGIDWVWIATNQQVRRGPSGK
jgi:AAA domain